MASSKPPRGGPKLLKREGRSAWLLARLPQRWPGMRQWRWITYALVALALAGIVILALQWSRYGAQARLASAYGAHLACSCHFIAGRPLDDCRKDFEPGMSLVTLSADEDAKSVTARVIPLASQIANWRQGQGCVLESWR